MEYHSAIWLEAYEGELYLLCKSLGSMDAYIYQITQQNTARCSDTALKMPMSFTFGDRCLFYISDDDSADSHSLMKVDLETLEISFISKEPGIEPTNFEYSDGRLYGHYVEYLKPVHDCYSISIHSGEKRLEEEDITGITVRDGWLYYTKRFSSGERGRYGIPNSRLYARNFKTGKTKDYGPIFIHGFYNYLEEHITFGKNGFVITKPNEYLGREGGWETLNLYYYYPYSGGEPVPLSLDEKTAAAT
jgi:hypothetical protein